MIAYVKHTHTHAHSRTRPHTQGAHKNDKQKIASLEYYFFYFSHT